MKSLRWEHEVLEQRFVRTQQERDDLYQKFIKAINEVQQKTGFKNVLLERKLHAMEEAIERKVCWDNSVITTHVLQKQRGLLLSESESRLLLQRSHMI